VAREIDLMHLGNDRVIAAHEVRGLIVDPGPSACLETLLDALEGEPGALLLTHIHLDHAGASGSLVRRFPGLRVYVHEAGAPHLIDPAKLLQSAARLYGEDMQRLWGEVLPIPSESVTALSGGEEVEGFRVEHTPGHAGHHVCYLDLEDGDAFVGDTAGVRIPPGDYTVAPTPPPEIDVEAWLRSVDLIEGLDPRRLRLTHFGVAKDVGAQLDRLRETLRRESDRARAGDRDAFLAAFEAEIERATDGDRGARLRQAVPPEQTWLGLERYWRKGPSRQGLRPDAG
jgi:glyoxylase-like metal-dependent hydrolase (beta-lactamase superfamily II)